MNIRLFARLREIAGTSELQLELPPGSTAQDAWTELARRYPAMSAYAATVSCAVNAEYARMATVVGDADEVAFLPPVSGG